MARGEKTARYRDQLSPLVSETAPHLHRTNSTISALAAPHKWPTAFFIFNYIPGAGIKKYTHSLGARGRAGWNMFPTERGRVSFYLSTARSSANYERAPK